MTSIRGTHTSITTILAVAGLFFLLLVQQPVWAKEIEAITRPSADIALSFVQAGKMRDVTVAEGTMVNKGDLLARQEDDAEMIQYQMLTAKAQDESQVKIAKAELVQKKKNLQKMTWAQNKGAATSWEEEHARLLTTIAELSLELAEFEHKQDILRQREFKATLDRLHLASPIDGRVEEVYVESGESVQALLPVVRIVNINPLLIEVAVPLAEANRLRPEQRATVKCADGTTLSGYVESISSVADAATDTLRVRVTAANPAKRPAGERVLVDFPAPAK